MTFHYDKDNTYQISKLQHKYSSFWRGRWNPLTPSPARDLKILVQVGLRPQFLSRQHILGPKKGISAGAAYSDLGDLRDLGDQSDLGDQRDLGDQSDQRDMTWVTSVTWMTYVT